MNIAAIIAARPTHTAHIINGSVEFVVVATDEPIYYHICDFYHTYDYYALVSGIASLLVLQCELQYNYNRQAHTEEYEMRNAAMVLMCHEVPQHVE